jgi:hypothetical protein
MRPISQELKIEFLDAVTWLISWQNRTPGRNPVNGKSNKKNKHAQRTRDRQNRSTRRALHNKKALKLNYWNSAKKLETLARFTENWIIFWKEQIGLETKDANKNAITEKILLSENLLILLAARQTELRN